MFKIVQAFNIGDSSYVLFKCSSWAKMLKGRRHKKSGKYSPLRGIRVPRKRRFEPVLATESGVKVRSQYEKRCADYLFRNEIEFQYEPIMLLGGRQFRPDFFLPEYNLFLEICGYGHMPFYRDHTAHKQQIYGRQKLRSVFLRYKGKGSLEAKIRTELERFGVKFLVPCRWIAPRRKVRGIKVSGVQIFESSMAEWG